MQLVHTEGFARDAACPDAYERAQATIVGLFGG